MLRYRDIPTHPTDLLDLTSLTVEECAALVPPFEAAFWRSRAAWTFHGQRQQSRRYTTSTHCPLPPPEARLLCILVSLKQNTMQTLPGGLFGRRQSQATHWLHGLLPGVRDPLRPTGDAPCRRVAAWRERLGAEVRPLPRASSALAEAPAATPQAVPLLVMPAPGAPSRAPQTRLNSNRALAARKSGPCGTTFCCATRL